MSCNAWNHPSDCNCGWGGWGWDAGRITTNGGRHESITSVYLGNLDYGVSKENTLKPLIKKFDELLISKEHILKSNLSKSNKPITYKVDCWWCQTSVFYHTNGYGDHVLFDHLGHPWKIHKCWQDYWKNKKSDSLINTRKSDLVFFNLSQKDKWNIINQGEKIYYETKLSILRELIEYTDIPTEKKLAMNLGVSVLYFRKIFGRLYFLRPDERYGGLLVKMKRCY